MDIIAQLLVSIVPIYIILSMFFIFPIPTFTTPDQSAITCTPDSCHPVHGPSVRFPFRLKDRQPARCGYPGFDLHCNSRNQTILNLPQSGEFVVDTINYEDEYLRIDDPGSCLANRALNFSSSGSPFSAPSSSRFTFLNCTERWHGGNLASLPCLSRRNVTVVAVPSWLPDADDVLSTCRKVADVEVPIHPVDWRLYRINKDQLFCDDFMLTWSKPGCGQCEEYYGTCGFKNDSGLEIACAGPSRISRDGRYLLIFFGVFFGVLELVLYTLWCFVIPVLEGGRRSTTTTTTGTEWPSQASPRSQCGCSSLCGCALFMTCNC